MKKEEILKELQSLEKEMENVNGMECEDTVKNSVEKLSTIKGLLPV